MGGSRQLMFVSMLAWAGCAAERAPGARAAQDGSLTAGSDGSETGEPDGGPTEDSEDGATARSDGGGSREPALGGECSLELSLAVKDKVDLLLVIDNSATMAEGQATIEHALAGMVRALTSGQLDQTRPDLPPEVPPVASLHVGVVSSDLGVNLAPSTESCAARSHPRARGHLRRHAARRQSAQGGGLAR